ncbi:type II toxin-antitoxin system death-on-curing family toxin [Phototrophicus methaneseepsis]|uniref:Type II toxin-antitoxin system death-on-curing family toxin n=1 Tax=Phototrophicus methaneseepsis TaxID=2710758 RepID=A0A7S8ECI6_9CHLR|nr:type II toxin-antitoxin system death-on-curing family toxin [Phototrophicus methaneseepsis]QPC84445.1 type II toxin-antitoxin system death-on-curing family toxin [Phototrophicus methaneseepsis]
MRYPTYSELIFINGRILNDEAIQTGKQKIRDIDLLQAAEMRPQASAFGEDAYPTIEVKTAALLHAIARNHPFKDGNKRTATVAALFMLHVNGWRVQWDMPTALTMILDLAEGRTTLDQFSEWLKLDPGEAAPEPDLANDTMIIDQIIEEQKWLLNELAER